MKEREKLFRCVPMRPEDQEKAKLLEEIINQPGCVDKITRATEKFMQDFIMPEIMFGKTFTTEEKDAGMKTIIEKINDVEERIEK